MARATSMHLFAGGCGDMAGLEAAGVEPLVAMNHWTRALETADRNWPGLDYMLGDISVVDPKRFGRLDVDFLVGGSECFPAGTTVLTHSGPAPIENVAVGEMVLTHIGRWRPVTRVMRRRGETIVIDGHGHPGLETTTEHPFFARRNGRRWSTAPRGYRRQLAARQWVAAADLTGHYWASPVAVEPLAVPDVPGRGMRLGPDLFWLVGRWLGDGSVSFPRPRKGQVNIACADDREADEIERRLECFVPAHAGPSRGGEMRWARRRTRTATVLMSGHAGLADWLVEHFGRGATGKTLPGWALGMEGAWRRALLDGYLSADGCSDNRRTRANTVSWPLAVGMRLLAEGLGHRTAISTSNHPSRSRIEGRDVDAKPIHELAWVNHPKHSYAEADGLHAWLRVHGIRSGRRDVEVFNLEVQEDHSYIADGIVVHNCDGHSMANSYRQAQRNLRPYWGPDHPASGLERSRATAWCFQRFAAVVKPRWVLVENVVDIRRWGPLRSWARTWDELGYNIKASCVNSAFFGVPQSRDRVIFCAWLKGLPEPDLDFRYPGWCWRCEASTYGRQWFKPAAVKAAGPLGPMGKYGPRNQWLVRCECCDEVMSPYITPAWTAIDWSIEAQRIGDRDRELSPKTMARIERGLRKFGWLPSGEAMPFISPHAYAGDTTGKNVRPSWLPAPTLTARQDTSLVVPPGFQVDLRGTNVPRELGDPMSTIAASGNHHALVLGNRTHATARDANGEPAQVVTSAHGGGVMLVQTAGHTFERPGYVRAWSGDAPVPAVTPTLDKGVVFPPLLEGEGFAVANYGGHGGGHVRDTTLEPLGTVTASGQQAVVRVPRYALMTSYYSTDAGRSIDEPAGTITPVDRHAIVEAPQDFMVRAGGTRQADVASLQAPSPTRMPTDSYGLLRGHVDVDECGFRMIEPHENQAIQDMAWREIPQPDGSVKRVPLVFQGSKRDRTALAGNGVPKALMTAHAERCLASVGA